MPSNLQNFTNGNPSDGTDVDSNDVKRELMFTHRNSFDSESSIVQDKSIVGTLGAVFGENSSVMGRIFAKYGRFVYRRPIHCIVACVLICAVLSSGLVKINVTTDPEKIWVPDGSETSQQQTYFGQAFHPFFRINQLIFTLKRTPAASLNQQYQRLWSNRRLRASDTSNLASGLQTIQEEMALFTSQEDVCSTANLLQKEYLVALTKLQQSIVTAVDSQGVRLDDLCYKPIAGQGCLVESPTNFWQSDVNLINETNPLDIQQRVACLTTNCNTAIGSPIMRQVLLGGIACCQNVTGVNHTLTACVDCDTGASALFTTFLLDGNTEKAAKAAVWEKEVFLNFAEKFQHPDLQVAYMAQRSLNDELATVASQNEFVVIVSYVAMFCYVSIALGKFPHPLSSRVLLALNGIIIVGASVASAIGLVSYCGMSITMIVSEVVPFLILAIGVDNMFIFTKAFDRLYKHEKHPSALELSFTKTFVEVGPSIGAAASSEILAFGLGATTNIPALQQFCAVAAIAVAMNFILQMTWFASAFSLDARRQRARRSDLIPCLTISRSWLSKAQSNKFWRFVNEGEYTRRAIRKFYIPVLFHPVCTGLVILVGLFLFGGSLYGISQLGMGMPQQLVVPEDSYLQAYYNQQADLEAAGPPVYVVMQNVNYTSPEAHDAIINLQSAVSQLKTAISPPVQCWWCDYSRFVEGNGGSTCPTPIAEGDAPIAIRAHQFVSELPIEGDCCQRQGICGARYASEIKYLWGPPSYLNISWRGGVHGPMASEYIRKISESDRINGSGHGYVPIEIISSRFMSQHTTLRTQDDFIHSMQELQAATTELGKSLPVFDMEALWNSLPSTAQPPSSIQNAAPAASYSGNYSDLQHTQWITTVPGGASFPYSLFYIYYEQYNFIRGVAVANFLLALGAVFAATTLITKLSTAFLVTVTVACASIDTIGFVWLWNPTVTGVNSPDPMHPQFGVDINAVSVVNLVAAVGLCVEFCVHIASAFTARHGTRRARAKRALEEMGSSVFTGITLTKLVGVIVLAWAPSHLFRLYYFRMYLGIIVMGGFHGLCFLPVILSLIGPGSDSTATFIVYELEDGSLAERLVDTDTSTDISNDLLHGFVPLKDSQQELLDKSVQKSVSKHDRTIN